MAPFQYQPFVNPYVPSISELLAHSGDAAAAAARANAEVRARAVTVAGNAWANAGENIGQIASHAADQVEQARRDAPRIALEKLQVGAETQTAQDDLLFRHAMAASGGDVGKAIESLKTMGGVGFGAIQKAQAFAVQQQQQQQALQQQHNDRAGELGLSIIRNGSTPDALKLAIKGAVDGKEMTPEEGDQLFQQTSEDPSKIRPLALSMVGRSPKARAEFSKTITGKPGEQIFREMEPTAPIATIPDKPVPLTAEQAKLDAYIAYLKLPNGTTWAQLSPEQRAGLTDYETPKAASQTHNMRLPGVGDVPVDYVPNKDGMGGKWMYQGQDVTGKVRDIPSAATVAITGSTLSQDALDAAAHKYLDSGVLPPGFGTAGVMQKTAIQNRAAQIDPTAALARNSAIYKADVANLTNLEKTEGTLSAFENTAGKNLDQFMKLAETIPDTGMPWLNTPVRLLTQQVVGQTNMAAINAARDVGLREIARVTNDPKLSGALTDSARREVFGLSPKDATLPQIKAVVKVLRQDMANVHSGLTDKIETVKGGIGGNPYTATAPASATTPDLSGLGAGKARSFNTGPFSGQTWTTGPDGKPQRVK